MGWLFRNRPVVPEWASFFTIQQFNRFAELVERYFHGRDLDVRIDNGEVRITEGKSMGLRTIAAVCQDSPPDNWPELIAQHFDVLMRTPSISDLLDHSSFADVEDRLVLQMLPTYILQRYDPKLIYRTPLEGVMSVLSLDLPEAVATITPEKAARWSRSEDELFDLALANVRAMGQPRPQTIEVGAENAVTLLISDCFYLPVWALMLNELEGVVGPGGSLVGIASNDIVLSCPIDGLNILGSVVPMVQLMIHAQQNRPKPISDNLYWYYEGRYTRLPWTRERQTICFEPPEAFNRILAGL